VRKGGEMRYVLITPARNEAEFIGLTIESVVAQSVKPERWVIVSDGSTDGTDEIVAGHAAEHGWIELYRRPERESRDFAGKVHCFRSGHERVREVPHEVVVSLDADLTFEADYFEYLLGKLAEDAGLGLVGTPFAEEGRTYDYRFTNIEHVSGACQVFRREGFEELGGYEPIEGGGIDWVAVTTARMKGWKTRTFTGRVCHHHRPMGTGTATNLGACFKLGGQEYYLGGHPLWQVVRSVYQAGRRPYVVGGALLLAGYLWSWARGEERRVSEELMRFHQAEQLGRLRGMLGGRGRGGSAGVGDTSSG